jgi:hypothetical protein
MLPLAAWTESRLFLVRGYGRKHEGRIIAVGALIMAAFESFNQRIASASFLGTLGVVCTFMVFMPKLEVFKVWCIEARLTKTLDRAEEILGKLQRLSAISAKSTYMSYAWANRMGTPSARAKQTILDDVDKQLAELNVSPAERKQMARPYITMIGWDFYQFYVQVNDRYMGSKYAELASEMNNGQRTEENTKKIEQWAQLNSEWRSKVFVDGLFAKAQRMEIDSLLADPNDFFDKPDKEVIATFKAEMSRLFKESAAKGIDG